MKKLLFVLMAFFCLNGLFIHGKSCTFAWNCGRGETCKPNKNPFKKGSCVKAPPSPFEKFLNRFGDCFKTDPDLIAGLAALGFTGAALTGALLCSSSGMVTVAAGEGVELMVAPAAGLAAMAPQVLGVLSACSISAGLAGTAITVLGTCAIKAAQ